MSHVKRYMLLALLTAAVCIFKFNNFGKDYETVSSFRGANLQKTDWNPLIADSVNDRKIFLSVDSKEYNSKDTPFYMDTNLNLMVPIDILTESLSCSSHLYDGEKLLVEKRKDSVLFGLNHSKIQVNEHTKEIDSPLVEKDGVYYVSLNDLSENIGYHFQWDMEKNKAVAVDASENASVFPARYDLRDKMRLGKIKNQGATDTCWAFAALSALESSLLPEEDIQFSADHMSLGSSFSLKEQIGGEYTMGMAYLLSWQGPVTEAQDPFDEKLTEGLSAVKHVQEVQMIEGKDYEKIKAAVFQYGGVQTSIYNTLQNSTSTSEFFDDNKNAYCYIGTEKPNHEVVIIGWDDNYSKENFPVNVEGDGAFICQNSWGENFGDKGVFYVSYYDTNIGSHNVVYTKTEEANNYDRIYQSDLCGWVGQMGYNKESVFGANVYSAKQAEELSAVGFYATGKETEYKVYLVKNFEGKKSFEKRQKIAEGKLKNAGYYTIPVETRQLKKGERFAVVVYLNTPDSVHPMAVEYAADEATREVDISDGEGYISSLGKTWEHVEETSACNLCIKAYTNEK